MENLGALGVKPHDARVKVVSVGVWKAFEVVSWVDEEVDSAGGEDSATVQTDPDLEHVAELRPDHVLNAHHAIPAQAMVNALGFSYLETEDDLEGILIDQSQNRDNRV